jgi:hypothetical protein
MSHFSTAYVGGPEPEKLSELRAKTDRQLLGLLHSKLELGLNFVALAEQTDSDEKGAEQLLRRAEQAVIEVKQLLPVLTEDQHRSVGPELTKLQGALEHLGRNPERPTTPLGSVDPSCQFRLAISVQSSSEPSSSTQMQEMAFRENPPCSAGIG